MYHVALAAWELMEGGDTDPMDALVEGCAVCELTPKGCGSSVGYGDRPDEQGETTQDAMVMDG